eukprot:532767-Rhodomonas_salina.1
MDEELSQTKKRQSFNFRKEKWLQFVREANVWLYKDGRLASWVIETEPNIRKALKDSSLPPETGYGALSAAQAVAGEGAGAAAAAADAQAKADEAAKLKRKQNIIEHQMTVYNFFYTRNPTQFKNTDLTSMDFTTKIFTE